MSSPVQSASQLNRIRMCSKFLIFAHVLIGKPVPTFPGHALDHASKPYRRQRREARAAVCRLPRRRHWRRPGRRVRRRIQQLVRRRSTHLRRRELLPNRADKPRKRRLIAAAKRGHAEDRLRPERVRLKARDDGDVQPRHNVAQRRDVDRVASRHFPARASEASAPVR